VSRHIINKIFGSASTLSAG